MINVDGYSFLAFLDLTCYLEIQIQVFSDCTVSPDSKETELRSNIQENSPSAGKNTGLVPKLLPTSISGYVDIPEVVIC